MAKKIHCKNDFELCYLRHQYLRRTNINPKKEELSPFFPIIHKISGKNYSTYKKLFYSVGLNFDDIVRINEAHLISYLGLFRIEKDETKYASFVDKFREKNHFLPTENDVLDKNKANFTSFLKQRMEDTVRICRQKVRNVRGVPMQAYHFFFGPEVPTGTNEEIIAGHEKYSLRKVDPAIFRAIKKKAKPFNPEQFFFNNSWYLAIPTNYRALEASDFLTADLDPRDAVHNKNPEELILMSESTKNWNREYKKFKKIPSEVKLDMIKSFIETNKGSNLFKNELKTAHRIVTRLQK